jgi:hypothetical protein
MKLYRPPPHSFTRVCNDVGDRWRAAVGHASRYSEPLNVTSPPPTPAATAPGDGSGTNGVEEAVALPSRPSPSVKRMSIMPYRRAPLLHHPRSVLTSFNRAIDIESIGEKSHSSVSRIIPSPMAFADITEEAGPSSDSNSTAAVQQLFLSDAATNSHAFPVPSSTHTAGNAPSSSRLSDKMACALARWGVGVYGVGGESCRCAYYAMRDVQLENCDCRAALRGRRPFSTGAQPLKFVPITIVVNY